jgi:hypothetical protein
MTTRRDFLKAGASAMVAGIMPVSMVCLAFANPIQDFSFAYISDAHIQHIKGNKFVRKWDQGLKRAVAEANLTYDDWTFNRWESPERRMVEMAGLDNPNSSLFMVGEKQREWLRNDLAQVSHDTPIVVFSHSPLQKIYKGWNFWTEDADELQKMLQPFKKVNVIYGHVHQIQYNQIGNIAFNSVMATVWPYPMACAQCHPNGANTHPETYPKFQKQLGRVAEIGERVNWRIRNPLEGSDLAANDPRLVAMQAYLAKERAGVPVAPGKH